MHTLHPYSIQDFCIRDLIFSPFFLRQLIIRKWLSLLAWRWYTIQASYAYKWIGSTTACKTFIFVSSHWLYFDTRHFHMVCQCYASFNNPGSYLIIKVRCSWLCSCFQDRWLTDNLYTLISVLFLFLLVWGIGCGLWLWHSLDFSINFFS